jgi:hypothetical protein
MQHRNEPAWHLFIAAVAMTTDHKPNTKEERQRIEKAGGVVVWAGTWRVGGVLAVSRAFGDRPLKPFVIPTPDIQDEWLSHDDEFLILASDGLWDVVSNQASTAPDLPLVLCFGPRLVASALRTKSGLCLAAVVCTCCCVSAVNTLPC